MAAVVATLLLLAVIVWLAVLVSVSTLQALGASLDAGSLDQFIGFLFQCAAIAIVTVAAIQVVRGLVPFRGWFHRSEVEKWLATNLADAGEVWRRAEVDALADRFLAAWVSDTAAREVRRELATRLGGQESLRAFEEAWSQRSAALWIDGHDMSIETAFESAWEEQSSFDPPEALRGKWIGRAVDVWNGLSELKPFKQLWRRQKVSEADLKQRALTHLVEHAVTHGRQELFDLPLERLTGQIAAAAEQVLLHPRGAMVLLAALAGPRSALAYRDALDARRADRRPDAAEHEIGAARNLIGQRIQRSLDGLHIAVGVRWRRRLRVVALAISGAIALGLVGGEGPTDHPLDWLAFLVGPANLLRVLVISLVSAFLAAVLRDLVAVVEKQRG